MRWCNPSYSTAGVGRRARGKSKAAPCAVKKRGGDLKRVQSLDADEKVRGDDLGALVNQLVEGVLAVRS